MSGAERDDISPVVTSIRENVKDNIRIARFKHRQEELDNLRITLGTAEDDAVNLKTFTPNDVLAIVTKLKRNRHATPTDLLKLSHAFLQSHENINLFVNTTGALPVVVKEMTGNRTETQILAIECMCNLSLGPEISCEKVAQRAGTYLHTFLQSSNESLVRTSLWCLTNLIVAGKRPLNILLSQELIKGLLNVILSSHNEHLKNELHVAIELIFDHGGIPSPSDVDILSKWILNQAAPLDFGLTRVVYKLLNLPEFKLNDVTAVQNLVHISFDTIIHVYDSSVSSPDNLIELLHHAILLMRICANIVAVENSAADYIIDNWFRPQNRSMSTFFNHFIDIFIANSLSIEEIYWFIGNLMKCQLSAPSIKYLEMDEFFAKIQMVA